MNISRRKVPSLLKQKMIELSFHDKRFPFIVEEKCKGLKGEELDKCIDKLLEELYKKEAYERLKAMYQEIYPRSWKKKLKEIYKERWKFFYERKSDFLPVLKDEGSPQLIRNYISHLRGSREAQRTPPI
jgi:hypothetical protein